MMMAGNHHHTKNYHSVRINQPDVAGIKKPGHVDRGFLCSFLDRLLGDGWERPVHLA